MNLGITKFSFPGFARQPAALILEFPSRFTNGTTDSGLELFGVDTLKANGQLATDGFDALRDFDANGNGTIDANDAVFGQLRIWRDLNLDGVSQANELSTLAQAGIATIGVNPEALASTQGGANLQQTGDGNTISAVGRFTRTNGSVGTTGEVNGAVNGGCFTLAG